MGQLVREVFTPLVCSGFGAPALPAGSTHHGTCRERQAIHAGAAGPRRRQPGGDGPDHRAPARDLAYAIAHLAGARGPTDWLPASNGTRIHTSAGRAFADTTQFPANGYAMGWLIWRDAASGNVPILMHDGSNRSFYALVWLVPSRNLAFVIVTNAGDEVAGTALNDVLQALRDGIDAFRFHVRPSRRAR